MKIYYAKAVYNNKEISAVMKVLKNPTALMNGPAVKKFFFFDKVCFFLKNKYSFLKYLDMRNVFFS